MGGSCSTSAQKPAQNGGSVGQQEGHKQGHLTKAKEVAVLKVAQKVLEELAELSQGGPVGAGVMARVEKVQAAGLTALMALVHDEEANAAPLVDGHWRKAVGAPPGGPDKEWQNWGMTLAYTPASHHRPRTSADVLRVVEEAAQKGRRVRCVGHGHTWTPLFFSEKDQAEVLFIADLELHGAPGRRIALERAAQRSSTPGGPHTPARVRLSAGVTTGELADWLEDNAEGVGRVGLGSDVILDTVRYGGVIAIPCHGTGNDQRAVPDGVVGLTLVHQVEGCWGVATYDSSHPHWGVLRSNFGMAGVIIDLTFELDSNLDKPYVRVQHSFPPMGEYFEGGPAKLKALVEGAVASEIFWFPLNSVDLGDLLDLDSERYLTGWRPMADRMWLNMFEERVDADPADVQHFSQQDPTKSWQVVEMKLGKKLNNWSQKHAFLRGQAAGGVMTMATMPLQAEAGYLRNGPKTLMRAIHYKFAIDEMFCYDYEVCFPVAPDFGNVFAAWVAAVDITERTIRRDRTNPVNLAVEMRFTRGSDVLMCPSYVAPGGDKDELYCWIEVLGSTAQPLEGWLALVKEVHDAWCAIPHPRGFVPKPHWAKITDLGEAARLLGRPPPEDDWMVRHLKQVYAPQLAGLRAALADLDPTNTFACSWVAGLYGA